MNAVSDYQSRTSLNLCLFYRLHQEPRTLVETFSKFHKKQGIEVETVKEYFHRIDPHGVIEELYQSTREPNLVKSHKNGQHADVAAERLVYLGVTPLAWCKQGKKFFASLKRLQKAVYGI